MPNRVVLGRVTASGSATYGLFVSRPGVNVVDGSGNLTSTENLLFDSRKQAQGNIVAQGTYTFEVPAGLGVHNSPVILYGQDLGYVPLLMFCARVTGLYSGQTNHIATQAYPQHYYYADTGGGKLLTVSSGDCSVLYAYDITRTGFRMRAQVYNNLFLGYGQSAWTAVIAWWAMGYGAVTPINVGP